jgi:phosphoserine aminotransferase
MKRVYNFNPGPAVLPLSVLEQVQHELLDYQGLGMSIMEMSHRSKEFEAVNANVEATLKRLLNLGDDYRVLLLQGGASHQFAMLPFNFLPTAGSADYVVTGVWAEKAVEEAQKVGQARIAASTKTLEYRRKPTNAELDLDPQAAYVHITSNETIQGTQWHTLPNVGQVPLVADMSSDLLSRPFAANQFHMIYGGAQKNLGPSGVTVVIIRSAWLEQANTAIPTVLRYATHAKNQSLYNTPPTFGIYMLGLVLGWIEGLGGLTALAQRNQQKADLVYAAIDRSGGFYRGHALPEARSQMNVTFRLPTEELEKQFIREATSAAMIGLAGHRSVGGIRASLYNALELDACQVLVRFMDDFLRENG